MKKDRLRNMVVVIFIAVFSLTSLSGCDLSDDDEATIAQKVKILCALFFGVNGDLAAGFFGGTEGLGQTSDRGQTFQAVPLSILYTITGIAFDGMYGFAVGKGGYIAELMMMG